MPWCLGTVARLTGIARSRAVTTQPDAIASTAGRSLSIAGFTWNILSRDDAVRMSSELTLDAEAAARLCSPLHGDICSRSGCVARQLVLETRSESASGARPRRVHALIERCRR